MKLLIVITINGHNECSVQLSQRASHALANDRSVDLPRSLNDAINVFRTVSINGFSVVVDLAALASLASRHGRASIASWIDDAQHGRIDVHRIDDTR